VLVVHATRAFRDRVPGPAAAVDDISTTTLGPWYATHLRRRPLLKLLHLRIGTAASYCLSCSGGLGCAVEVS
jgi:hypothetical protein